MFTPLVLFLGLTVATAVIAHWSDNLGKKLGKKRVSLFGLRPRTTATVLTVASSWAIMLFTLVALLTAVAPLRRALFSYDRERAQAQLDRESAKSQIETARSRLKETQSQFDESSGQLKQAQLDLKKADQSVRKSKEAARKARAEGKRAEEIEKKRADEARKRANRAESQADEAQKRVSEAQKRVSEAQKEAKRAGKQTESAQLQARAAQNLSRLAALDLKNSLADLKGAQNQLKGAQNQLKNTRNNLETARGNVEKARSLLLKNYREVLSTDRQLRALQKQRDDFQSLAAATSTFVSNDAPVKVGQTFAARIIPANQRPETIAAQLRELVKQGQESFAASEDENPAPSFPPGASLHLAPLTEQKLGSVNSVVLEGDELLGRLARDIALKGQTTSVRLVAARNFLANETRIEAIFVAVPIAPAFESGEVLASTTIDGAQGDALIFNSLLELLNLGRSAAEKRGANPPESPNQQFYFFSLGTNVRLFRALRLIESSKKRLRVDLVAMKALSTVEPLQVRFDVEESDSSVPTS